MNKTLVLGVLSTVVLTLPVLADHHENAGAIATAMSAAPPAIASEATIITSDGTVLREGSNGWTCSPGSDAEFDDPVCNDAAWAHYYRSDKDGDGQTVEIIGTGVSFMLASDPPHLMIIVPEAGGLDGLNTDASDSNAWVMWGDRPGRHIMVPIGLTSGDDGAE